MSAADLRRLDLGTRDGNRRDVRRLGGYARPRDARIAAGVGRPSASGIRRAFRHRLGNERRARVALRSVRGRELVSTVLRRRTRDAVGRGPRYLPRAARRARITRRGRLRRLAAAAREQRRILGSAYLGAVVPDTDAVHNVDRRDAASPGPVRRRRGRVPRGPEAPRRLGGCQPQSRHRAGRKRPRGGIDRATCVARCSSRLDNGGAQYELGQRCSSSSASSRMRRIVCVRRSAPCRTSAGAHNDLGIALASIGDLNEAIEHFRRAVALDPEFGEPAAISRPRRRRRRDERLYRASSALVIAPRSSGDSGVTSLGKNATILPSLPMTYLLKFHAGRWPDVPEELVDGRLILRRPSSRASRTSGTSRRR